MKKKKGILKCLQYIEKRRNKYVIRRKKIEEVIKDIKIFINDYISESIDENGYTQYEIGEEEQEFFSKVNKALYYITKLQKENENLLREKEENKFIIAMANNEMLGYNQGYSDAKNQNSNATEIVIKNRQTYIYKEEVELYKRKIDFLQKENEELKSTINKQSLDISNNLIELQQKDKQIDLMAELVCKRFKAELLLEYGFENEEQLKQYFADLVEKE